MKKTLTVNLGGTVYNIDEDAYYLLDNYLKNLRVHFKKAGDADEIVQDMEERISELFDEYLASGIRVITIVQAEEVITRMGRPEQLDGSAEAGQEYGQEPKETWASGEVKRRLFRNPDDRILGGVVSGFSAYVGWDTTLVRLAMIVLGIFLPGALVIAYLIAWIIIPAARTAAEKLQMRGKPVSVENIGRTVTDGFEQTGDSVSDGGSSSTLHRIGEVVVGIAGFLIKFVFVLLALCCIPVFLSIIFGAFALLLVASGVLISIPTFFTGLLPQFDWALLTTHPALGISLSVCGLLFVGIPIAGLFQLVMQSFCHWKPVSTTAKVWLTVLWLLATVVGMILLSQLPTSYGWTYTI